MNPQIETILNINFILNIAISFLLPLLLGIVFCVRNGTRKIQKVGKGLILGGIIGLGFNLFDVFIVYPLLPPIQAPIGIFNIAIMGFSLIFVVIGFFLSVVPDLYLQRKWGQIVIPVCMGLSIIFYVIFWLHNVFR